MSVIASVIDDACGQTPEDDFSSDWMNAGFNSRVELPRDRSWFVWKMAPKGWYLYPAAEIAQWARDIIGGHIRSQIDVRGVPHFRFKNDADALVFKMAWL